MPFLLTSVQTPIFIKYVLATEHKLYIVLLKLQRSFFELITDILTELLKIVLKTIKLIYISTQSPDT